MAKHYQVFVFFTYVTVNFNSMIYLPVKSALNAQHCINMSLKTLEKVLEILGNVLEFFLINLWEFLISARVGKYTLVYKFVPLCLTTTPIFLGGFFALFVTTETGEIHNNYLMA